MKKDWEYKKLGDVCEIIGGGTPDKKNTSYYEGSIPWATVRDMNCDILHSTDFCISEAGLKNSASHLIDKGEIIIATRVGLGKVCKLAQDTAINQDLKGIVPKRNNIDRGFLFFYFKNKAKYIEDNGVGATVKGVKLKFIEDLLFPIIDISEQQRIVSYLDAAFAKIDAMKANAENALKEAKALFQASLKEMMQPKPGWMEKKLVNEFSLKSGENLSAKNQVKGPYPVYGGNGITGYHNKYNLSGDQILIGRVGALCGNIHYTKENIWITDNAFVVNDISSSWNILFLSYELEYIDLNQYASQTAQPVISNKSMKDVSIFLPPLSEQQSIVAALDAIKSRVDRLQSNFDAISRECDALKQAILREVFEGE